MSERLVWFLVGAGAIYLLSHKRGGTNFRIGFNAGFGDTGVSTPPDQTWAQPDPQTFGQQGVWDPMGTPTWYQLYQPGSSGNKVMSGGGYTS